MENSENKALVVRENSPDGGKQFQPGHNQVNNVFLIKDVDQLQIGDHNTMYGAARDSDTDDSDSADEKDIQSVRACDEVVSDQQLRLVAQNVGEPWRLLAKFLGITTDTRDKIYDEFQKAGLEEVIFQLLCYWKKKCPDPTVCKLFSDLDRTNLKHLWKYLKPNSDL